MFFAADKEGLVLRAIAFEREQHAISDILNVYEIDRLIAHADQRLQSFIDGLKKCEDGGVAGTIDSRKPKNCDRKILTGALAFFFGGPFRFAVGRDGVRRREFVDRLSIE